MNGCGKVFAEGVADGTHYALTCGQEGHFCNACIMSDASSRAVQEASEIVTIRHDETIEAPVDVQRGV